MNFFKKFSRKKKLSALKQMQEEKFDYSLLLDAINENLLPSQILEEKFSGYFVHDSEMNVVHHLALTCSEAKLTSENILFLKFKNLNEYVFFSCKKCIKGETLIKSITDMLTRSLDFNFLFKVYEKAIMCNEVSFSEETFLNEDFVNVLNLEKFLRQELKHLLEKQNSFPLFDSAISQEFIELIRRLRFDCETLFDAYAHKVSNQDCKKFLTSFVNESLTPGAYNFSVSGSELVLVAFTFPALQSPSEIISVICKNYPTDPNAAFNNFLNPSFKSKDFAEVSLRNQFLIELILTTFSYEKETASLVCVMPLQVKNFLMFLLNVDNNMQNDFNEQTLNRLFHFENIFENEIEYVEIFKVLWEGNALKDSVSFHEIWEVSKTV